MENVALRRAGHWEDALSAPGIATTLSLVLLAFALALRLLGLAKGIWLDEYSSISVISSRNIADALRIYDHPPLYFLLLKLWSLLGASEPWLRLLSVVCGVATVAVVMNWMRQCSTLASLVAGFCCATLPILLRFSQEIRDYPLLLLFTALSFSCASYIIAEPDNRWGYAGLGLSLALAVSTHLVGIALVGSVVVFIGFHPGALRRVRIVTLCVALGLPSILFVFIYAVFLTKVRQRTAATWWMPRLSPAMIAANADAVSGVSQLDLVPQIAGAALVTVGALLGNWRRSLPLLAAAGAYWLQVTLYSMLVLPVFIDRTLVPGVIPFIGFVAWQTATVRGRTLRVACCVAIALIGASFAANWVRRQAWQPLEDWRAVTGTIAAHWQAGAQVVLVQEYVAGPVKYYLPGLPNESVVFIRSAADVAMRLSENRRSGKPDAGPPVAFVVLRRDAIAERVAPVTDALTLHLASMFGQPRQTWDFQKLSVRFYRRPDPGSNGTATPGRPLSGHL